MYVEIFLYVLILFFAVFMIFVNVNMIKKANKNKIIIIQAIFYLFVAVISIIFIGIKLFDFFLLVRK